MNSPNTTMFGCGWTRSGYCPPTFIGCPTTANTGQPQAQAQFPTWPPAQCLNTYVDCPTHPVIVCTHVGCPPAAHAGPAPAQAQFPTLSCTFPPVVCAATYVLGCNGAQQQASPNVPHTMFGCVVSAAPHCPAPQPGQAANTAATVCTQVACPPPASADTAAQAPAQAQFPTWPLNQCIPNSVACLTIPPTVCIVTQIAQCGGAQAQAQAPATYPLPTLPPLCPMTASPMCPATIVCPPAPIAGQTQPGHSVIWLNCPTHFATVCTQIGCGNPGGGGGTPPFPNTLLGCPVTHTPFCHHTALPHCVPQHTIATVCTQIGCPAPAGGQAQAQAQAQAPYTLPVFDCITRSCTNIPWIC